MRFAQIMLDNGLSVADYEIMADTGFHTAVCEWVFAGALNRPDFGYEGMQALMRHLNVPFRTASAMRELAEPFVASAVEEILAGEPELIGFSCTFSQSVASLAVAKRIKQQRPEITIVVGGYNTESSMGIALHREFEFVDMVLRGEGDTAFPLMLRALELYRASGSSAALEKVPNLCWREPDGTQRVNSIPVALVQPVHFAKPDYTDWFQTFESIRVSRHVTPKLVVESSRGCWWGEKHHCTFCGLNGSAMTYRAKRPEVFVRELDELMVEHQVLDATVIDNILPVDYFRSTLPALSRKNTDHRLHYEIKANVTADHINLLRAAGVWVIQPGIESLVDDVLHRMEKGVRSVHNIRTIRDSGSAGITVSWNWLYGFPGERVDDYKAVIEQIPALVHLQPPGIICRIDLQRFSPNFDRPELGFLERVPAEGNRYVYDIPVERLQDLVYSFDTNPQGLTEQQATLVHEAVELWHERHGQSTLIAREIDRALIVRDRRAGWPAADYVFDDPRELEAWRLLEKGRSPHALRRLASVDAHWTEPKLHAWLAGLHAAGLVFVEAGQWITLPISPSTEFAPEIPPTFIPLTISAVPTSKAPE